MRLRPLLSLGVENLRGELGAAQLVQETAQFGLEQYDQHDYTGVQNKLYCPADDVQLHKVAYPCDDKDDYNALEYGVCAGAQQKLQGVVYKYRSQRYVKPVAPVGP